MELPPSTAVPVKGMRNNVFLFAPHTTAGPVGMGSDHSDKDVCVKMGKQPMARLARKKAKGCTVNYQRAPPYVTAYVYVKMVQHYLISSYTEMLFHSAHTPSRLRANATTAGPVDALLVHLLAEPSGNGPDMGHILHGGPEGALHGLLFVSTRDVFVQICRPDSFYYDFEAPYDVR